MNKHTHVYHENAGETGVVVIIVKSISQSLSQKVCIVRERASPRPSLQPRMTAGMTQTGEFPWVWKVVPGTNCPRRKKPVCDPSTDRISDCRLSSEPCHLHAIGTSSSIKARAPCEGACLHLCLKLLKTS